MSRPGADPLRLPGGCWRLVKRALPTLKLDSRPGRARLVVTYHVGIWSRQFNEYKWLAQARMYSSVYRCKRMWRRRHTHIYAHTYVDFGIPKRLDMIRQNANHSEINLSLGCISLYLGLSILKQNVYARSVHVQVSEGTPDNGSHSQLPGRPIKAGCNPANSLINLTQLGG